MLSVQNYMTDSVYTIKPTDSLHDVKQLMEGAQIRHAPVVNSDGRFCGLVTHRDLLNHTISQLADIDEQNRNQPSHSGQRHHANGYCLRSARSFHR